MFIHALDDRAISRAVVAIGEELAGGGIDTVIIAATISKIASRPTRLTVEHLDVGTGRTATGVHRLASVIRKLRPDVIFGHGNGPNRAAVLARMMFRLPIRVVAVEHTHYSTFYTGRSSIRDLMTRVLYPLADKISGVSQGVVDDLESRFPGMRGKTAILPSPGPRLDRIRALTSEPTGHPWLSDSPRGRIICSVGNIVPRKGQDILVRALPLIRREVPDARLLLVGRPDDQLFLERLKHLAISLGVERDVSFAGYQANPLPIVARSDVFALASTTEGFGISLVEAMACRVPVVSTDCPAGPSYVLENGHSGLLVTVQDPAAMANALIRVLRDNDLREELVVRGERRAAQFDPRIIAAQYLALAEAC